jgi:predicted aspartyl protease
MAIMTVAAFFALVGNLASPELTLVPRMTGSRFQRETLATATDPAGRMTVMTMVNGQGPFPFTIDTGANRSVISDHLAKGLGLSPNGTIMIEGLIGPDEVQAVRVGHMKAGTAEQREIDTAILPAASLGSTGFLGTDMLQGRNVILDFRRHRITLTRLANQGFDDGETITVTALRRLGQLVVTDASVNGVRVTAIIDTGAENTIGNPALRKMLVGSKPPGAMGELRSQHPHRQDARGQYADRLCRSAYLPPVRPGQRPGDPDRHGRAAHVRSRRDRLQPARGALQYRRRLEPCHPSGFESTSQRGFG